MTLEEAFSALQKKVDANPDVVQKARDRRNAFRKSLGIESDVKRTFASGSFARGSQIEPIKDVDLLALYDEAVHPDWGQAGDSAQAALEHLRDRIKERLGPDNVDPDSDIEPVRFTQVRDHAVTCWLDEPDAENAFTIDVVPALNRTADSGVPLGFWIPETSSRAWIGSDPLYMVYRVLERHERSGGQFVKRSAAAQALQPRPGQADEGLDHGSAGAKAHARRARAPGAGDLRRSRYPPRQPICDPAGYCGEIEPDLDRQAAADAFKEKGRLLARARKHRVAAGRDREGDLPAGARSSTRPPSLPAAARLIWALAAPSRGLRSGRRDGSATCSRADRWDDRGARAIYWRKAGSGGPSAREHEEMARRAPEMQWRDDLPAGGWSGLAPAPAGSTPPRPKASICSWQASASSWGSPTPRPSDGAAGSFPARSASGGRTARPPRLAPQRRRQPVPALPPTTGPATPPPPTW